MHPYHYPTYGPKRNRIPLGRGSPSGDGCGGDRGHPTTRRRSPDSGNLARRQVRPTQARPSRPFYGGGGGAGAPDAEGATWGGWSLASSESSPPPHPGSNPIMSRLRSIEQITRILKSSSSMDQPVFARVFRVLDRHDTRTEHAYRGACFQRHFGSWARGNRASPWGSTITITDSRASSCRRRCSTAG